MLVFFFWEMAASSDSLEVFFELVVCMILYAFICWLLNFSKCKGYVSNWLDLMSKLVFNAFFNREESMPISQSVQFDGKGNTIDFPDLVELG
ncbi:hypothetical protein M5K25_027411 [Dendrobium thyrsiflorum]|uniref:Uncharacterized protein n=1 Tax=Dendrobium thyrsiflorum TaxID=117978 RepID=A0ABD0U016_DENTH